MRYGYFLSLLALAYPSIAYASGNPAVLYFFALGGILQIAGLILILMDSSSRRLLQACLYIIFSALSWAWWLHLSTPTGGTSDWLFIGLPLAFIIGKLAFRRK
ncbi:hypothetical protein [Massilia sp. YIM B04103]|uniref:hypothetical protein n=1 Tax=Massilia sp. YIM B04103 TaxID=2963106 RepID=UPI00210866BC|nr:hypothetical protein [Massilia sp. YIM B04103]